MFSTAGGMMQQRLKAVCNIILVCAALLAAAGVQAQQAGQNPRIALVIGNATYRDAALATPANDAGLIAQTLQAAGFDVVGARDLDGQSLRTAFRDFLQKAEAAGPDMQAFVYLAGRAVQYNGDNYFVPVDARISRDADVPIEAIRMSDFTHALAATPGRARIIVLDAARANPYAGQGAPLAPGLALVDPEPGELIAFNAAPGTLAGDEEGPYGVFAKTLAGAIRQGGVDIAQAFDQTRVSVNAETQGALLPFSASRLGGPFYVFERAADAPPPGPSLAETERQPLSSLSAADAYAAALERDTMKGYREFLAAYPKSDQARRVRAILAVRREAAYWRRTAGADTPRAYWTYLHTYPKGPHVADARRRLAMLSAEFEPPPDFRPERFADLPPPPPDERIYEERPIYAFDDFGPPPPPPPEQYVYVEDDEWRDLPPPPPPTQVGLLPVLGFALPIAVGAVAYQGLFHRNGIAPQGAPRFRPPPPAPPPLPANIKPQAPPKPAAAASAAANGAVVKPLPPIGRRGRPGAPSARRSRSRAAEPCRDSRRSRSGSGRKDEPASRRRGGAGCSRRSGRQALAGANRAARPRWSCRKASGGGVSRRCGAGAGEPRQDPRGSGRARSGAEAASGPAGGRQSGRGRSASRASGRKDEPACRRRGGASCSRRSGRQALAGANRAARPRWSCRQASGCGVSRRCGARRSRRGGSGGSSSGAPRSPCARASRCGSRRASSGSPSCTRARASRGGPCGSSSGAPGSPRARASRCGPAAPRPAPPAVHAPAPAAAVPAAPRPAPPAVHAPAPPRRSLRLLVRRLRLSTRPRRPPRRLRLLVRRPRLSTRPRRRNCGPAESPACRPVRNRRAASAGHDKPALNGLADQGADPRRHRHRQRAPQADPERRPQHRSAARPGPERAEREEKDQRGGGDGLNDGALRREKRRQRRRSGADREGKSRREGGLDRFGLRALVQAKLVARMGVERVLGHELTSDLSRKLRLQAPLFVDMGELLPLFGRPLAQRVLFAREIGALRVGL